MIAPRTCSNCGSTLYADWWDASEGGHVCKRCGAVTTASPASTGDTAGRGCGIGVLLLILFLVAFIAVFTLIGGDCGVSCPH